jgi:parallel beta-helix repeat protein
MSNGCHFTRLTYDNALIQCGHEAAAYDTDGNGTIIDTFNGSGAEGRLYPYQTLVANNVSYNNGGKGIAIFRSAYVTVDNNTAYNNLDPWNKVYHDAKSTTLAVSNKNYLNNVVYAVPAASPSDPRCRGASYNPQPAPRPLMTNVGFFGGNAAGVIDANYTWANNGPVEHGSMSGSPIQRVRATLVSMVNFSALQINARQTRI